MRTTTKTIEIQNQLLPRSDALAIVVSQVSCINMMDKEDTRYNCVHMYSSLYKVRVFEAF